jgi:competence protein ComEA
VDDDVVPGGPPGGWERDRWLEVVDRLREDRDLAAALAVVLVVVAAGFGAWWLTQPTPGPRPEDVLPRAAPSVATTTTTIAPPVLVHVVGAVLEPGVRELAPGSRVVDALDAAGGPSADADLARLNLAAPVTDGSQIRVPAVGEEVAGPLVVEPAPPGGARSGGSAGPVPLNTADAALLETLPGVGPATAGAIITWRDAHGPFRTVEQLLEVRGIGPAKFEALRDLVVVG